MALLPDSIIEDIATLFDKTVSIGGADYSASVSDLAAGQELQIAGFASENGIRVCMKASDWPGGAPALNIKLIYDGDTYRIKTSRMDDVCVYLTCEDPNK